MITTTTRYHSIKRRKITMTVVYHVLVAAASLAMLYPLFWMLSSSFKPNNEIFTTVGNLIPQTFTTICLKTTVFRLFYCLFLT